MLHRADRDPQPFDLPPVGRGDAHEFSEVAECLRGGRSESAVMPLDGTVAVMAVLDEAGTQLRLPWSEDPAVPVWPTR